MPILKNPKHELFAQRRALGEASTAAFVQAGYKANEGNAGRLNRNELVQARVQELLERKARFVAVTLEEVIGNCRAIYEAAMEVQQVKSSEGIVMYEKRDLAAANKSTELLGKSIAAWVDAKTDVPYSNMSDSELRKKVAEILEKGKGSSDG